MTLSDYLLRELRPIADLPRLDDVLEEVRQGPLVDLDVETAELIRLGREENDDKMVVAGASALVDALIRRGVRGDWAAAALAGNDAHSATRRNAL